MVIMVTERTRAKRRRKLGIDQSMWKGKRPKALRTLTANRRSRFDPRTEDDDDDDDDN